MENLRHDILYSSRDLNTSQAWANLLGDSKCIVSATNMVEQTTNYGAEHYSIVSQHFVEPEGSMPNSQELSTCSYP
jgi:hypothetical protein